jgi:hypothetical protein
MRLSSGPGARGPTRRRAGGQSGGAASGKHLCIGLDLKSLGRDDEADEALGRARELELEEK